MASCTIDSDLTAKVQLALVVEPEDAVTACRAEC